MDINKNNEIYPSIVEFFKGKTIFITGGTGFMGKVLIEKLLWSCPDIKAIYLLMRSKKGLNENQRLIDLEKKMLFERVRKRDPKLFFEKVKTVTGDVCELQLGLSSEDRQMLIDSVSIVYHAAASVRFDDPLKQSIIMNTRGTREIMLLARDMKHLEFLLHVSTTFCNADKEVVEEILYPPHADWETSIKVAETMDDSIINALTIKYIKDFPNTYVFTKSLAEHVVNDLRGNIPTIIYRPSIVVSSVKEPMAGWIDNFNGPVGLLVACAKGVMRSMYCPRPVRADFIPVDVAIRGMLISTWKHAVIEKKTPSVVPVYNCSTANVKNMTYHDIISTGLELVDELPFNNVLWIPGGGITASKIRHMINFIFFHMIPALLVDTALKISGRKPLLWRLQRRIHVASNALNHYTKNEWLFKNEKFLDLCNLLSPQEREDFYYSPDEVEVKVFLKIAMIGARRYLLKEPDETIPMAVKQHKRLYILDCTLRVIFYGALIWFLYTSVYLRKCMNELYLYASGSA